MTSLRTLSARRLLIGATAVLLAITTACGGAPPASPAGADTLPISVLVNTGYVPGLPLIVAKERGLFAQNGLDATLVSDIRGDTAQLSALVSGSVDLEGQSVATAAKTFQTGTRLPLVASYVAGVPYVLVVSSRLAGSVPAATPGPEGWQATVRALKGVTIAASGGGGAFDSYLKALFSDAGLAETDFSNINIALQPGAQLAAFQSGQVDASMADPATAASLEAAGGRTVLDMARQGPDWLTGQAWSGFMMSQDTIDENPELAKRVQAVIADTKAFFRDPANLPELHRIAVQVSGVPESPALDGVLTGLTQLMVDDFGDDQMAVTLEFLTRTGQLKPEPTVTARDILSPSLAG